MPLFFTLSTSRLFWELSLCSSRINTVGDMYSGGPALRVNSSPYITYIIFDLLSTGVSIPYDTTTVNQTGNKSKLLDKRKTFSNFTMLHYDASLLSSHNLLALKLDKYYVATLISTKLHHTTYTSCRF